MSVFVFDSVSVLVLFVIFVLMGVAGVVIAQLVRGRDVGIIAEGYAEVAGGMSQVFRKSLPTDAQAFTIGKERQFLVDLQFASMRTSWNHWGGNHPILRYHIDDARPMSNSFKVITDKAQVKADAIRPTPIKLERMGSKGAVPKGEPGKPSSKGLNMMIRQKGLATMIMGIKGVAMNPWIAAACGAIIGAGIIYAITVATAHPPACTPQAGFYCSLVPIPKNVTVIG